MEVFCAGTARIQHRETGEIFSVASEDLDWDEEGMGEGPMGTEIQHKAVVEHSSLGRLTWTLREYPVGVEDDRETDVGEHTLLDDVRYSLRHEAD